MPGSGSAAAPPGGRGIPEGNSAPSAVNVPTKYFVLKMLTEQFHFIHVD